MMDRNLTNYVIRYFRHLMSADETSAYRHLLTTMKAMGMGRTDAQAQEQAKGKKLLAKWLSDDPNVLSLARDGYDAFMERTATRILTEQGNKVFMNCCPQCGALARTPKARQCRFCGHDWHKKV